MRASNTMERINPQTTCAASCLPIQHTRNNRPYGERFRHRRRSTNAHVRNGGQHHITIKKQREEVAKPNLKTRDSIYIRIMLMAVMMIGRWSLLRFSRKHTFYTSFIQNDVFIICPNAFVFIEILLRP